MNSKEIAELAEKKGIEFRSGTTLSPSTILCYKDDQLVVFVAAPFLVIREGEGEWQLLVPVAGFVTPQEGYYEFHKRGVPPEFADLQQDALTKIAEQYKSTPETLCREGSESFAILSGMKKK